MQSAAAARRTARTWPHARAQRYCGRLSSCLRPGNRLNPRWSIYLSLDDRLWSWLTGVITAEHSLEVRLFGFDRCAREEAWISEAGTRACNRPSRETDLD